MADSLRWRSRLLRSVLLSAGDDSRHFRRGVQVQELVAEAMADWVCLYVVESAYCLV